MISKRLDTSLLPVVKIVLIIFTIVGFNIEESSAQTYDPTNSLVLLKGHLITSDSLLPVADAQIISRHLLWGTISDTNGLFYLHVDVNDTLLISSMGFKNKLLFMKNYDTALDSLITIKMEKDTIMLNEVLIRAFWDYETFKQMIIDMRPPDNIQINFKDDDMILNRPLQPSIGGPIQALYNVFNHTAKLQRKLIKNRKRYNELMIQMGRAQDTIPSIPEHMQGR